VHRHLLVVATDGKVREALSADLRAMGFKITLAVNASQALRVAKSVSVQAVLIESHLPDMPATELRTRLQEIRPNCRIVVLSGFNLVRNSSELLQFGANDYLVHTDQVVELLKSADTTGVDVDTWSGKGTQALINVIDGLVGLLELEYRRFGSTSHVAMELARATVEELGADEDMMYEVVLGTLLRDLGRAGLEPEPLTEKVFTDSERNRFIDEHVTASLRMFEHIDFPWKVLSVVRHHHERYNGTGAPDGLRGREIPMGARIVSVVDAYVALTSGKGEDSMNPDEALRVLAEETGRQFDPEVVEAFNRVIDKRLLGRKSSKKPVVLLAEPEPQFRRLLKVHLANIGLTVKEARNYEKCKEHMLKSPPDLAIINIDADPWEAFQLLDEIQRDENLCRVPIAFLSTRNDRSLKLRALRQGVEDYMIKGDDMEELIARVENIVVRRAIRADGESRRGRRGVMGRLENLGLPDIVQTLTIGMKTACVSLTSGKRTGRIWFENGTPKHAQCAQLTGEDAFYEMMRWKAGEFVIEHRSRTRRNTIEHDSMFLLMEGLRQIDERASADAKAAS
jgi:response regulator RpfG family c-di-GMP phosphodiesterase